MENKTMAFDRNDTYSQVIEIVAEKLNSEKESIHGTSTFESLGADSLDMAEIVLDLESKLNIEIEDADAEKLTNIDQVVDYIQRKRTA